MPATTENNQVAAILADLQKEVWAMEPRALNAMFQKVANLVVEADNREMQAALAAARRPVRARLLQVSGQTGVIPISGYLMKEVPWYFAWLGIAATAQSDIRDAIADALADRDVKTIVLHVESPGGQVSGGAETAEVLMAARAVKPVVAYIEDLGASGAYWLASQASAIAANDNAMVGSIGVYTVYADYSQQAENLGITVHVIRSGEHKGMGVVGAPITEEQIAAMQSMVAAMADNFVAAVAAGRGRAKKEMAELATGQVWIAAEAAKLGLVDRVGTHSREELGALGNGTKARNDVKENIMPDNEKTEQKMDVEQVRQEAAAAATKAERERFAALTAAFPDDAEFAAKQYQAGASVEQAKVAYCEVLQVKLAEANKQIEDLKIQVAAGNKQAEASGKETAVSEGAEPVKHGEAATGGVDFVAAAKERAKADGISVSAAMSLLAKENPEGHAAWLAKNRRVPG